MLSSFSRFRIDVNYEHKEQISNLLKILGTSGLERDESLVISFVASNQDLKNPQNLEDLGKSSKGLEELY